ncbi:MAG TPA: FkbM family methyltransferase, partial [Cytophagaceae bacterium]|nr:FkbM family methyltransferase [Cytophagaceae bacterium]
PFFRPFLTWFVFFNYLRKGEKIKKVRYIKSLNKWYYKVGNFSFLSTSAGWAYSFSFLFEQLKHISCYDYLPKEGDVVIDIGAGIGEESIVFSSLVGKSGFVYSIEAHPRVFEALKYIIEDNKLSNISTSNIAVSNKREIVEIDDNLGKDDSYLGNSIGTSSGKENIFKVEGFTLDEFVKNNNIQNINFLRTNIEGAERLMLEGMKQSVEILENAAISCHDFRYYNGDGEFFRSKESVMKFFRENGFDVKHRTDQNSMINDYVYATKKRRV